MNTKMARLKESLKAIIMQFQSERITTDKGIVDVAKAGDEIAVGDTVMGVDEDGNSVSLESGEYKLTDGTILKIEDGRIVEIVEPENDEVKPEEEPVEENAEKVKFMQVKGEFEESYDEKTRKIAEALHSEGYEGWVTEAGDDYAVMSVWAEDMEKHYRFAISWDEEGNPVVGEREEVKEAYVPVDEEVVEEPEVVEVVEEEKPVEETFEEVEDPTNEGEETDTEAVVKLREEVNELYKVVDELTKRLDAIENKPAADRATEEFARVNKIKSTGDEKLDNLSRYCK